jgi:hypothetical protein
MKKTLQITLITTCVLMMFVFSGVVSAISQSDLTVRPIPSTNEAAPGQTINIRVFLTNNAANSVTIDYVGIHFDWMPSDGFYGYDLSDSPVTIEAGQSTPFGPISVAVSSTATAGEHTYFVGIEGVEGSSSSFSWDSPTSTLVVTGSNVNPSSNPSQTSTTDGSSSSLPTNLLLDIVLIVVIVVVVVFMLVFLKRGKNKPASAEPAEEQPTVPADGSPAESEA